MLLQIDIIIHVKSLRLGPFPTTRHKNLRLSTSLPQFNYLPSSGPLRLQVRIIQTSIRSYNILDVYKLSVL